MAGPNRLVLFRRLLSSTNLIVYPIAFDLAPVKIMSLRKQLIVIRGCTGSNWRHNGDDIDDG
jgi:hypothetical protein